MFLLPSYKFNLRYLNLSYKWLRHVPYWDGPEVQPRLPLSLSSLLIFNLQQTVQLCLDFVTTLVYRKYTVLNHSYRERSTTTKHHFTLRYSYTKENVTTNRKGETVLNDKMDKWVFQTLWLRRQFQGPAAILQYKNTTDRNKFLLFAITNTQHRQTKTLQLI